MVIVSPALQIIPVELKSSFNTATYLVGGPLLSYGVSSFFWVPLGNRFGARLVFVLCAIAAACMCCWAAKATSFGTLVVARTLASAFFAPPETLGPQMIGDVFYLKDRAKTMALIGILQASGFAGGPLIGGFIIQNSVLGWRWLDWIEAIIVFGVASGLFLILPETQYTGNLGVRKPTRTWADDFRFWPVSGGGTPKVRSLSDAFLTIFPYFCHPIIILNTAFFSLCLVVTSYVLTSQSLIYLTVYPFSVRNSGVPFVAPLIGTWFAFACGMLSDRVIVRRINKEGKPPNPERRLPLLASTGAFGIAGSILFGVCTQEQCHWVGPLFGSAFVNFSFVASLTVSFAYLLDVYESRMDTVMVIYNGMKNLAAFGISYAIIPWNTTAGYTVPFVLMAVILLVAHFLMVLVWWKGEAMREWTSEKFETARTVHHGVST